MDFPLTHTAPFRTDFCLSMANQVLLKEHEKGSNYVFSPLSLHLALSLIAGGTKGRTLEQLLSCLGSESISNLNKLSSQIIALAEQRQQEQQLSPAPEPKRLKSEDKDSKRTLTGPTLSFANGLWVEQKYGLKPSFKEIAKNVYKVEAKEVDFVNKSDEVGQEVNSWVERETGGLIKQVLPPGSIELDTAVIVANALYFKGAWNRSFDPAKTKNKEFHLLNGQIVQAPCMTGKSSPRLYDYNSFDDYKVLRLPYQSGGDDSRRFSMYFFLPSENNGLPSLVRKLNSKSGFFHQQFNLQRKKIPNFWIPRFKFSFEFEASKFIKEMGLDMIFNPGELTEMINHRSEYVCLSKMFHKSCIEVNEEGTEAAASSAAVIRLVSGMSPIPSFVADHPFIFMIREENSRAVFFIGAVLNPQLVS